MATKIAGVDEAGRGPLAGPVVAGAVILPEGWSYEGLTDSKKMTERRREKAYDAIVGNAVAWSIGVASVAEIDQHNILQATFMAMQRAVAKLETTPDRILVDGNRSPNFGIPSESVVGGDGTELVISAASVLAKVVRDRLMMALHHHFPDYGFDRHKGYGTAGHMEALRRLGPTAHHRMSFAPVRACSREGAL